MSETQQRAALQARLDAVDEGAQRTHTACGEGALVWRRWARGSFEANGGVANDGTASSRPLAPRPVILVHGGSGSWTHWIKTIPALATTRDVWCVDLPGLGDSAMPDAPHVPMRAGLVVAEGIEALFPAGALSHEGAHEAARPHVVGFSFGGHIATLAAALLGHRIASLTLTGCAAMGLPHHDFTFAKEHPSMDAAAREAVHRANLAMLMFADIANIDALALHIQATNVRRARFRSRVYARGAQLAETLPAVRVPVNAVWGARDQIALPSVDARFDVIARSHPQLIARAVPDAGHWAMYENADAYNEALIEVLAAMDAISSDALP
ncbi:MAG: alpha/beta fold hydrolase [Pseudomonadota bacterium]